MSLTVILRTRRFPAASLAVIVICAFSRLPFLSARLTARSVFLVVLSRNFVLTFAATFAILAAMPIVAAWRLPRWCAPAVSMLVASAATEALVFPIGAFVFSRITFAGLALNFLAIPLMAVAQIAGMAVVPVALVSRTAAALVGGIAHVGAAGLVWSADLVRFAPAVSYRIAPPSAMTSAPR